MKPLVIYHANCADGFGAAFAAWTVLGYEAIYTPAQYGQFDTHEPIAGRDVYILDFSLPKEQMDYMFTHAKRVVWLDHHKTAFEMWAGENYLSSHDTWQNDVYEGRHKIWLDNNKSGAMLAWEYFHPGEVVPKLIHLIDDRDRWVFKYGDDSRALHAALHLQKPWEFKSWAQWVPNLGGSSTHLQIAINKGHTILAFQRQQVEDSAKRAMKCAIDLRKCAGDPDLFEGLAVNTPVNISEVGHALAVQSGTFGLVWYYDAKEKMAQCSLRSNGDYDVSAIAKALGGGGHLNAAGFRVPMTTLMGWL